MRHTESSAALLAMAHAMDRRAAERYRELASVFEMSCNPDTAQAFTQLAEIETTRADLPKTSAPPTTTSLHPAALDWFDHCPEISDPDSVHYLMLPWHAFDLAHRLEERCRDHFLSVARAAEEGEIANTAHALADRENRHAQEVLTRRDACPKPHARWWEDQDGPNWDAD